MKDKFAAIYEPYIRLSGEWDYAKYAAICGELGVVPDALITTFTDRIGFLVAAVQTYPQMSQSDACFEYSKFAMKSWSEMQGGVNLEQAVDNSNVVVQAPCCGGGKVR